MEKTGDNEYRVFWQNELPLMRLPGGEIIPYDGRFGIVELNQERVFPND